MSERISVKELHRRVPLLSGADTEITSAQLRALLEAVEAAQALRVVNDDLFASVEAAWDELDRVLNRFDFEGAS